MARAGTRGEPRQAGTVPNGPRKAARLEGVARAGGERAWPGPGGEAEERPRTPKAGLWGRGREPETRQSDGGEGVWRARPKY